MEIVVEYPIILHIDNFGAVLLPDNKSASQCKKHIDVFHHFICDYVEDRIVKIKIFRSEYNMADQFTNNLSNGPFESLTSRYINSE